MVGIIAQPLHYNKTGLRTEEEFLTIKLRHGRKNARAANNTEYQGE